MYNGKVVTGLVWLVAVVLGDMAFIVPGLILHLICIIMAAGGGPVYEPPDGSTGGP